jgi:hypothetical protein
MRNALLVVGAGALVLAGGWWFLASEQTARNDSSPAPISEEAAQNAGTEPIAPGASIGGENLVEFRCDGGNSVTAVFARDIVGLALSDGRQMELRLKEGTESQYENLSGTIEFRGVGEGAMLVEGGKTTYANCAAMP